MRARRIAILLCAALGALQARAEPRPDVAGDLPEYRPQDPSVPAVGEEDLLDHERFWPYHVSLVRAWQPPGAAQPLAEGSLGVLIRVEDGGVLRADFGRNGVHRLPIAATDLVKQANLVRSGEQGKLAPNFVLAIGPRLIDPAAASIRPLGLRAASEPRGFLCVFADPRAEGFAELASALRSVSDGQRVATLLFPHGDLADLEVRERLRAVHWPVPFVYDQFAEPYTRSLLDDGTPLPALTLQTREGRLLFQGAYRPDVLPALSAALARGFGAGAATSRASAAGSPAPR